MLGRVQEQLWREKKLKDERKVVNTTGEGDLKEAAEMAGAEEGIGKKGKRRKRKAAHVDEDGEKPNKRRAS